MFLAENADINSQTNKGKTPLHIVCENNTNHNDNKKMIEILLKNNSNINIKDGDGNTPMHIASQKGFKDIIKEFLKHQEKNGNMISQINDKNNYGWTPLHMACQNGSLEIVKVLLEKKADIYIKTNENKNALHISCENGYYEIVNELIEKARILKNDKNYINTYLTVYDNNVSNNPNNNNGMTSLHIACKKGYTKIVKLLLNNNVNINLRTEDKEMTALHIACIYSEDDSHKDIVFEIIDKLNDKTKDFINLKSKGWTALHFAIYYKNPEIVKKLLESGANIEDKVEDNGSDMNNLNAAQIIYKRKKQAKDIAEKNKINPKDDEDVKKYKNIEKIISNHRKDEYINNIRNRASLDNFIKLIFSKK